MSILFLDIDGVLNSVEAVKAGRDVKVAGRGIWGLDPVAVAHLGRILTEVPDTEIVLSSTWRTLYSLEAMRAFLQRAGLSGAHADLLKFKTGQRADGHRGKEVLAWFVEHAEYRDAHYAILDDDADFLPGQPLVRTMVSYGLGTREADKVIKLLKGEPI